MRSRTVSGSAFLLVFDRGDEITEVLISFARDHAITGASFTAIGACSRALIAYWNAVTKDYEEIEVSEQVEVVSLSGNVAAGEDGRPRVHAHVALGRRDGSVIGGHLLGGIVHPTLELFLITFDVALQRRRDEETGLQLLELQGLLSRA